MSALLLDPVLREWLLSVGLLSASYLAARLLSHLFGLLILRAAGRTPSTLDDRLAAALRRPVTYALFLLGAYLSVHRLPLQAAWLLRLDLGLFALGTLLMALALVRAYDILLGWYAHESRHGQDSALRGEFGPLVSKLGKLFIVLLLATVALKHFGVDVDSLVVSLGVGSLALGMAAKDTLANMIAGFTLLLDRPFVAGDRIRLASGETGDVLAIGMRATRLKTPDETLLVMPNSVLVGERVVNLSRPGRQATTRLELGVAYGSDLRQVKQLMVESAQASELTDPERPPQAYLTRFADYAIQLQLVFWVKDYALQQQATSDVYEGLYGRLVAAGVEIPLPVRRVIQETAAAQPGPARASDLEVGEA